VGTSALRDAAGGESFLIRTREMLGFEVEVVSGTREAELTFVGALSGIELRAAKTDGRDQSFVFDIGGGSTELIVGRSMGREGAQGSAISACTSLNIGSVRLTERNRPSDPPSRQQLERIRTQARDALRASTIIVPPDCVVVGVAGTVTTLFAISENMSDYEPEKVHGRLLTKRAIDAVSSRLAQMTLKERIQVPGLSPGRADVIVAGSILCSEILEYARASELVVSDRGVRFGVLQELIQARG
jgi:exopolyphosphatase/guanosine-5'-triphosphate,3'-diphosphate pyrophosphatase